MTAPLFGSQDARSSFEHYFSEISKEINSKSNDFILNVNATEWKQFFIDRYGFIPLTIYPEGISLKFKTKITTTKEIRGHIIPSEAYIFQIRIPFRGSSLLLFLKPSTRYISHPIVDIPNGDDGYVTNEVTLHNQDRRELENAQKEFLTALEKNAININCDVEIYNDRVARHFDQEYKNKKEKVIKEQQFFESLNIDIETSTDKIFKVPVAVKKKIPEPIIDKKSTKSFSPNSPTLPDEFYDDILEVINTFFKSVEKKPSTYQSKDEEGLRDYILPTLETRYSNTTVTGETFNKSGKTDILVKYKDNTNLFVAECKIWKGEAVLIETINQLFDRYLTWRDSKVAVIFL